MRDAFVLCVTERVAREYGSRIRSLAPRASLAVLHDDGRWDPEAPDWDVFFLSEDLFGKRDAMRNAIRRLNEQPPRWMHSASTGVDHPLFAAVPTAGGTLTNTPGGHGPPIAEFVFAYLLHYVRRIPERLAEQAAHRWTPLQSGELLGKTIGIVGYGGIGQEIAKRAQAFGMRVLGLKRTAPAGDPYIDEYLPSDRLHDLLGASDYVVVATPLTTETVGLIGEAELAAMRPTALLVNVGRGPIVVKEALLEALRERRIAGAILDVADPEPLPEDSPLWDLPNCWITPHDSPNVPSAFERTCEFFFTNLAHWVREEPLEWEVTDPAFLNVR